MCMSRLGECQQRNGNCKLEMLEIKTKSSRKELVNQKMGSQKLPELKYKNRVESNHNSTNSCGTILSSLTCAIGIPKEERMGTTQGSGTGNHTAQFIFTLSLLFSIEPHLSLGCASCLSRSEAVWCQLPRVNFGK